MNKAIKSVIADADQILLASQFIKEQARLQVLESVTTLSRHRLIKLYKEILNQSPSKGMLPFSTDWFMTWQPNIHSSLYMNIYRSLEKSTKLAKPELMLKAFELYQEQVALIELPQVLSITRVWTLVKFFEARIFDLTPCTSCAAQYVIHKHDPRQNFVCGLCHVPSRAGKTKKTISRVETLEYDLIEA